MAGLNKDDERREGDTFRRARFFLQYPEALYKQEKGGDLKVILNRNNFEMGHQIFWRKGL